MYEFKDLSRLTLIASVLVGAFAFTDLLASGASFLQGPPSPDAFRSADAFELVNLVLLIACLFAVGRWIYRASLNAHALGSEMTISPGWAVGWYFVPFANLVKPFHAMREIWLASHESDGSFEERVPILGWWWGLWIVTNILSNAAWRLGELGVGPTVDMIAAGLNVPLCVILITIMRDIESSQRYVRHALTFA
jgi:hypothetical protein